MAAVNKVILVGNLGRDPELRYASNGSLMAANVSVATTSSWKDKVTGERHEDTEWHRVVFFGRQAEVVGQYLKKGNPIYVEGHLKSRKWQDKQGVDRYTTEIIADQMQMLGSRDSAQASTTSSTQVRNQVPVTATGPVANSSSVSELDDDIPF